MGLKGMLLSDRDVSHVLMALRHYQKDGCPELPFFGEDTPTEKEVDDLCERINLSVPHA